MLVLCSLLLHFQVVFHLQKCLQAWVESITKGPASKCSSVCRRRHPKYTFDDCFRVPFKSKLFTSPLNIMITMFFIWCSFSYHLWRIYLYFPFFVKPFSSMCPLITMLSQFCYILVLLELRVTWEAIFRRKDVCNPIKFLDLLLTLPGMFCTLHKKKKSQTIFWAPHNCLLHDWLC